MSSFPEPREKRLVELCERLLEEVHGQAEALVSVTQGHDALTRFANSAIHQNVAEDVLTITLKAVVDGRSATSTRSGPIKGDTAVDSDVVRALVDRTVEAACLRPPDPDWPGLAPPAPVPPVEHYDEATREASPDERAEIVRAFVDAGLEAAPGNDAGVGMEAAGFCSSNGATVALANSGGQRLVARSSSATIDGIQRFGTSDGSAGRTSVRLADLDGELCGRLAAATARAGAQPIDLEPGRYEVVLTPDCVGAILAFLAYAGFNAKSYADGTSFARLGEAQFDTSISLYDDVTDGRALGLPFDTEGTPKRRVELVKEGVIKGLAHDRRTAARAGVKSTGHASGSEEVGPVPTNLFLAEGLKSPDELMASVERGLLVSDFWYTRILDPKTQVVTGLTRNGLFLIEGGRVGGAVRDLRFTQSFVDALGPGQVKGVGNDGRLAGLAHVPTLHLGSWNFTGGAEG